MSTIVFLRIEETQTKLLKSKALMKTLLIDQDQ